MNNLCADIGYKSINHYGEELCGDHIDIIEQYAFVYQQLYPQFLPFVY